MPLDIIDTKKHSSSNCYLEIEKRVFSRKIHVAVQRYIGEHTFFVSWRILVHCRKPQTYTKRARNIKFFCDFDMFVSSELVQTSKFNSELLN